MTIFFKYGREHSSLGLPWLRLCFGTPSEIFCVCHCMAAVFKPTVFPVSVTGTSPYAAIMTCNQRLHETTIVTYTRVHQEPSTFFEQLLPCTKVLHSGKK